MQVIKKGRPLRLFSRRGNQWTDRLPALAEALARMPCSSAILDAELCLPSAGGVPDFCRMPAAMRRGRQTELIVFAFDLLHRDGRDGARCRSPSVAGAFNGY